MNITVCMPAYGGAIAPHTAESLFTLAQWMTSVRIPSQICWLSMNGIEDCRNTFLTIWYDHFPESTHLLFVDSDMAFKHQLIIDMLRFDKPLTGCMYAKRQMTPPEAVGVVLENYQTTKDVVDGFLKVRGVGAGVMLIKRETITKMLEKLPELIDESPIEMQVAYPTLKNYNAKRFLRCFDKLKVDHHAPLSEDLAFCERWRRCDGEIWANVEHLIGHVGPFNFASRYMDTLELQERTNAEPMTWKDQKEAAA